MTSTHYLNAVLDCLREHGVTDAESGHGGKHPFVRFTHGGRRHRVTLGHDGRQHSIHMALQGVRRLLGAPTPAPVKRERRRLEDMGPVMPGSPESFNPLPLEQQRYPGAAPTSLIRALLALYAKGQVSGPRLRVNVSVDAVGGWNGVDARRHDADTWELWDEPRSSRRWIKGDRAGFVKVDLLDLTDGLAPFGCSPAEVVEVDGHLLLTCRTADRSPVRGSSRIVTPVSVEVTPPTAEQTVIPPPTPTDDRTRMLAVLREVAALEGATGYCLVRVKDDARRRWEWQAPPVRLEG